MVVNCQADTTNTVASDDVSRCLPDPDQTQSVDWWSGSQPWQLSGTGDISVLGKRLECKPLSPGPPPELLFNVHQLSLSLPVFSVTALHQPPVAARLRQISTFTIPAD